MKEPEDFNSEKIQNYISFKAQCYTDECDVEIKDYLNPQFLTRQQYRNIVGVPQVFWCVSWCGTG